ncbi:MAG: hypothetical protein R2860_12490 [Desulfobacterales bacterium]
MTGELQNALGLHDLGYHAVFGDLDDPRTTNVSGWMQRPWWWSEQ